MKKSVLLALSGGVDSCVCAHLLMQQGYDVQAVVMKMSPLHDDTISAAKSAAKSLNIPLTVLDLQEIFDEKIITYFINEYVNGRTPNPCIMCNPKVKFKYLLETANKLNCDYIATGHYAITNENGEIYASLDAKAPSNDSPSSPPSTPEPPRRTNPAHPHSHRSPDNAPVHGNKTIPGRARTTPAPPRRAHGNADRRNDPLPDRSIRLSGKAYAPAENSRHMRQRATQPPHRNTTSPSAVSKPFSAIA